MLCHIHDYNIRKQDTMPSAQPSSPIVHYEYLDTATAFTELFGHHDDTPILTAATTTQQPNEF
jgi:hypothetical protein